MTSQWMRRRIGSLENQFNPGIAAWLVAVGTALASGPPHRSVREELPHTALTSGSCDGQPFLRTQLVVRATNSGTRFPGSVSGTSALVVRSPWSPSFPLRTPLLTHLRQ